MTVSGAGGRPRAPAAVGVRVPWCATWRSCWRAAECAGGARWCLDVGTAYAIERRQFGRPIGQFQAIKHRLADMLVAVEQVTALAWDAAQAADAGDADQARLSAVLAGAFALDAYVECAKGCIQILGGHGVHVGARRPPAPAPGPDGAPAAGAELAPCGSRRRAPRSHGSRRRLEHRSARGRRAHPGGGARRGRRGGRRPRRRGASSAPGRARDCSRRTGPRRGDAGRDRSSSWSSTRSSPRPTCTGRTWPSGAWALPTIIAHGTPEQQERWVGPTLRGELVWCQLFSEPGAGSDLAALSMRATRHDGGWVLNGQKVWTSIAHARRLGDLPGPQRPRRDQARGHHVLHRRHAQPRASRSDPCARSPGRRCSTRCSSPTCSCPTTAWWER